MTSSIKRLLLLVAVCLPLSAQDALFPEAKHFVRRVENPLAKSVTTLQEYCAGNQLVTVNGDRVAVMDYAKQELLEIDRAAGTYSITRFDELAALQAREESNRQSWTARPLGTRRFATTGRALDTVALQRDRDTIELGLDRRVTLTRAAAEVLIGAAYPNVKRPEHDAILSALRTESAYALPVEQSVTYEAEGQSVTLRSSVVSVTGDRVPHELVVIPPGAVRVESHAVRTARMLRELDQLPGVPKP